MFIDGLGVVWITYRLFLSAVWTLILTAPIHCRGAIGEQVMKWYISHNLFWWRTTWMAWEGVHLQQIFILKNATKKNNRTLPGSRLFHLNGNEFNSGAISVLTCCYRCVKEAYSDWMRVLWFKSPRQMEQCLLSTLSLTITYWHHFVSLRYYANVSSWSQFNI